MLELLRVLLRLSFSAARCTNILIGEFHELGLPRRVALLGGFFGGQFCMHAFGADAVAAGDFGA